VAVCDLFGMATEDGRALFVNPFVLKLKIRWGRKSLLETR